MAKQKLGNPYAAIANIAKGRKLEEFDIFIRNPDDWIPAIEGAHYLASVVRSVPVGIHDELSKLLSLINEEPRVGGVWETQDTE